jgi:hypothetical protein
MSVTIGNSVENIGTEAFYQCSSLESITIPNSVTNIEYKAFEGCSALTSVTIGNSLTSIGYSVFPGCISLTSFQVDNSNTAYSSEDGVLFNKTKTMLILYPAGKAGTYTIPNSVTFIGDVAFSECNSLTSVIIPNSVTDIGDGAFYYSSLTTVTIPNSVTDIGNHVFCGCSGLTSVTIPNSVTVIGDYAFGSCTGLTEIINYQEIPQSITIVTNSRWRNSGTFYGVDTVNCILRVPAGTEEDYRIADGWKDFTNIKEIQ